MTQQFAVTVELIRVFLNLVYFGLDNGAHTSYTRYISVKVNSYQYAALCVVLY